MSRQSLINTKRYLKGFVKIFFIYIFIGYFIFGTRTIGFLLVHSIIVCSFAMILVRLYVGRDIGIYRYESNFTTKLNKTDLIAELNKFAESNKGQISIESDNIIIIKFGKKFSLQRLLGFNWATKRKYFVMPCKVKVVITELPSQLDVTLNYEDNMNSGYIRGERYDNAFKEYFKRIDTALLECIRGVL